MDQRRKIVSAALVLYWAAIFLLTHIPQVPRWVLSAQMSDKSMHYIAYLVLTFLWWSAICPDEKVNWRRQPVWWTLVLMVWYGAIDEWLQHYVGRTPDIRDFQADLAGTLTVLALFTVLNFLPMLLCVCAICIFMITNVSKANLIGLSPLVSDIFHFVSYGVFAVVWVFNLKSFNPQNMTIFKRLAAALSVPLGFLLFVKTISAFINKEILPADTLLAVAGITIVVLIYCVFTESSKVDDLSY